MTAIEKFAFANCPSLTYMELSPYITSIAASAFLNDPDLTLGVWYGSYGYEYAIAQNIPYVLLDGVKLGDVGGDDEEGSKVQVAAAVGVTVASHGAAVKVGKITAKLEETAT